MGQQYEIFYYLYVPLGNQQKLIMFHISVESASNIAKLQRKGHKYFHMGHDMRKPVFGGLQTTKALPDNITPRLATSEITIF